MHRPLKTAAFALLGAALARPVQPAEPRVRPNRYRLGPFEVMPRLLVKHAGVDTNVFQTLIAPVRDDVLVLSPQIDGTLRVGRRFRATGTGFLDTYYYRREGEERSTDFFGGGQAVWDLGRLELQGGGGGGQFSQRYSIDVDERLKRQEKQGYVGARLRLGPRVSLVGRGSGEVLTFAPGLLRTGARVKESLDRNTLIATGQLRYALTNRTDLIVSGEALEDRFFSQRGPTPRTRRSYRALGGFEVREAASRRTPSGRLLAGMREFPGTLAQGSPPYQGPVVSAEISVPLGRLGVLRMVGERDVRFASSLVDLGTLRYRNAYVYERLLAEQVFGLPFRMFALVSGGVEEARYLLPYPYLSRNFLASRVDHRWTGRAVVARRFGDSMRLGGHIVWARRVSSLPLYSYEGLTYGLTAEVTP